MKKNTSLPILRRMFFGMNLQNFLESILNLIRFYSFDEAMSNLESIIIDNWKSEFSNSNFFNLNIHSLLSKLIIKKKNIVKLALQLKEKESKIIKKDYNLRLESLILNDGRENHHAINDISIEDIKKNCIYNDDSLEIIRRYEKFYSLNLSVIRESWIDYFYIQNSYIKFDFSEKRSKNNLKLNAKEFVKVLIKYEESEVLSNDRKIKIEKKNLVTKSKAKSIFTNNQIKFTLEKNNKLSKDKSKEKNEKIKRESITKPIFKSQNELIKLVSQSKNKQKTAPNVFKPKNYKNQQNDKKIVNNTVKELQICKNSRNCKSVINENITFKNFQIDSDTNRLSSQNNIKIKYKPKDNIKNSVYGNKENNLFDGFNKKNTKTAYTSNIVHFSVNTSISKLVNRSLNKKSMKISVDTHQKKIALNIEGKKNLISLNLKNIQKKFV